VSQTIARMIIEHRSIEEIKTKAEEEGMLTLRADGLLKIKKGITTAEEVIRETAKH
jgi:type IV pilus assembly protein PilB